MLHKFKKMNILITGCNGFLGKEFASYFANENYNLFLTNRNTLDVTDSKAVNKFFDEHNIDIVLHTAVKGGQRDQPDNHDIFLKNLIMFDNLVRNRDKFGLMINFGSGAAFDKTKDLDNTSEEKIFNRFPSDYYGLSKNMIAREILKINNNIVNFRLFGCFGEHEHSFRMIKNSLNRAFDEQTIVIHQNKLMDFFYVKDLCVVVEHYIHNFKNGRQLPHELNLVYEEKTTLKEVACYIRDKINNEIRVIINEKYYSKCYTGSARKLFSLNLPFTGLWKGIDEVISARRKTTTNIRSS